MLSARPRRPLPSAPSPFAVKVQLAPYNRIRLMKIPIIQASAGASLMSDIWLKVHICAVCVCPRPCVRLSPSPLVQPASSAALTRQHACPPPRHLLPRLQAFLTRLLTVDLPGLMTLPQRLEINIPPAVTAGAHSLSLICLLGAASAEIP